MGDLIGGSPGASHTASLRTWGTVRDSRPGAANCGAGRRDDGRLPRRGPEPARTRGAGHGGQRLLRREGRGGGRPVGARVVADPIAAINDPEVDAVLIASPGAAHQEQVNACLDVGMPVLCEKPLTTDVASAYAIVQQEAALSPAADPGRLHAPLRPGVRRAEGPDHVRRSGQPADRALRPPQPGRPRLLRLRVHGARLGRARGGRGPVPAGRGDQHASRSSGASPPRRRPQAPATR